MQYKLVIMTKPGKRGLTLFNSRTFPGMSLTYRMLRMTSLYTLRSKKCPLVFDVVRSSRHCDEKSYTTHLVAGDGVFLCSLPTACLKSIAKDIIYYPG